jgi:ATP-dependent Clp protease ATP-binding subunit ClpA
MSCVPLRALAHRDRTGHDAGVFDRFTDRARKVMGLARQEAQRLNHDYIGTEHMLLGLVKEGAGVAASVLKNLEIDLEKIRTEVERLARPGTTAVSPTGQLPFTPRGKKVLELSLEEASGLGHTYIGTEHLLLGLLRENEGIAAQVLGNLKVKVEDLREEVLELLAAEEPERAPPPRRTVGHPLDRLIEAIRAEPEAMERVLGPLGVSSDTLLAALHWELSSGAQAKAKERPAERDEDAMHRVARGLARVLVAKGIPTDVFVAAVRAEVAKIEGGKGPPRPRAGPGTSKS